MLSQFIESVPGEVAELAEGARLLSVPEASEPACIKGSRGLCLCGFANDSDIVGAGSDIDRQGPFWTRICTYFVHGIVSLKYYPALPSRE